MNATIRVLPYLRADGPRQMAADEVMLESAVAGVASFRFYGWDPPTLSLGYFQPHEERLNDPKLANMAWIRRATGGGAIVHDNDLTYAIALPPHSAKAKSPSEWHCAFHHALAGVLRKSDVAAEVLSGSRPPQADLKYLCFAVPQPGDVVVGGEKVIGGAQRLRAGALLQHGSMQIPTIHDHVRLAQQFAQALGWQMSAEDWTGEEQNRIRALAAEKYGQDCWNRKR